MRILTLTLQLPLHAGDIPDFRRGIINLVGREHELFHNHDNAIEGEDHHHWGYPLVQYTVRQGQATVMGIGDGADALQRVLIPKLPDQLLNNLCPKSHHHHWQILDAPKHYGLYGWLALNQANFQDWKANTLPEARTAILERALTGHLRVIAKAAGIEPLEQVVGSVVQVDNQKRAAFHGTQLVRFHALVASTLDLPFGIGVGRAAAFGFGELMPVRVYQNIMRHQSKGVEMAG